MVKDEYDLVFVQRGAADVVYGTDPADVLDKRTETAGMLLQVYYKNGQEVLDASGNPVTIVSTIIALTPVDGYTSNSEPSETPYEFEVTVAEDDPRYIYPPSSEMLYDIFVIPLGIKAVGPTTVTVSAGTSHEDAVKKMIGEMTFVDENGDPVAIDMTNITNYSYTGSTITADINGLTGLTIEEVIIYADSPYTAGFYSLSGYTPVAVKYKAIDEFVFGEPGNLEIDIVQ